MCRLLFFIVNKQQKKMVHSISFIQSKSFGTKHYTKYTQAFKQTNKQKQNMVEIERERERERERNIHYTS